MGRLLTCFVEGQDRGPSGGRGRFAAALLGVGGLAGSRAATAQLAGLQRLGLYVCELANRSGGKMS